jgi:phosphoesterase RecJ-like protein
MESMHNIQSVINSSQSILLISHRNPDGDTLGSSLALHLALESMGKQATPVCIDPVPKELSFLPASERVVDSFRPEDYDLLVILDCADQENLTGFYKTYPEFFNKVISINIDHHPSNKHFGTYQLIRDTAAACAVIMVDLFQVLDVEITKDIATCLLTGIMTDTGGFQHSNTSPEVMQKVASLLEYGADIEAIISHVFRAKTVDTLRLWGKILRDLQATPDRKIVWGHASKEIFSETHTSSEQLSGLISLIYGIQEAKATVLLQEREDGQLKGSIRTKNGEDANALAAQFGGGGHKKAAGFVVRVPQQE